MNEPPVPLVLGYSIPPALAAALHRLCLAEGAAYFSIAPRHYLLPIDRLPIAADEQRPASPLDPPALPEPMLLFKGFDDAALVHFLQAYRTAELPRVELKASLTPHNAQWDSLHLWQELRQEREALR